MNTLKALPEEAPAYLAPGSRVYYEDKKAQYERGRAQLLDHLNQVNAQRDALLAQLNAQIGALQVLEEILRDL